MVNSIVVREDNIAYVSEVTDYTEEELAQILAAYNKHGENVVRIPLGKGWRKNHGVNRTAPVVPAGDWDTD